MKNNDVNVPAKKNKHRFHILSIQYIHGKKHPVMVDRPLTDVFLALYV